MTNQEAIKIIEGECEHIKSHLKCKGKAEEFYKELGDMCIAFYMAINALEQEPKTGHWIGIDEEPHEDYECDICGYMCSTFTANIKPSDEYKYCPNCGKRLK